MNPIRISASLRSSTSSNSSPSGSSFHCSNASRTACFWSGSPTQLTNWRLPSVKRTSSPSVWRSKK